MVSTRGPKHRFTEGEKVLCYEPDPTKAKVLYDSKVLGAYETKDKRGRKLIQYKIHFQGWSSTWDRKVNSDFVLKDTEENRQLQKDLAEKAQLQLGAYLYRRERKKRTRQEDESDSSPKIRNRGSSEDNFSSSSTFEKNEGDFLMRDECETESCSSSVESFHDDDRVLLKVSDRLKQYLEYDYEMIVRNGRQHVLPTRIPVLGILENFVKQSAVKLVFSTQQNESTRRRNTALRPEKKEREFEKIVNTVSLLKEVADGLRIYFDFTLVDHLLYKQEKEIASLVLSEENLKNFSYVPSPGLSPDFLSPKSDSEVPVPAEPVEPPAAAEPSTPSTSEDPQKRKLRSHRSEDCDALLETCLSSIASTSSGGSTPLQTSVTASSLNYIKSLQPMALSIPPQAKDFLQKVLSWQILPSNANPAPSMIFGAVHLARLIVKLPEFLNASTLSEEKLKLLLQHLDSFVHYLESRKEWFGEHNYFKEPKAESDKLAEKPADKLGDRTAEKSTDKPTDKPVAASTDKAAGKSVNKPVGKSVEKATAKSADKPINKAADKTSNKPAPEKTASKSAEKCADKLADKSTDKSVDKSADELADKPADKSTDKPGDKPTAKQVDKSMNKPSDKAANKSSEKSTDETSEKPSDDAKTPHDDKAVSKS